MKRTYVRVTIAMSSDWRIGSWDTRSADAVETLIDRAGQPLVPGTGIAGGLRAALPPHDAAGLFGPTPTPRSAPGVRGGTQQPGTPRTTSTAAKASPWWVLGTTVSDAPIQQRRRTAIDRRRGAAARRGMFSVEEVGGGVLTVYFRSEVDDPRPFLDLVAAWRPRIGGGRTTGLGVGQVTAIRYRTVELDTKAGLKALLATSADSAVGRVDELLDSGADWTVLSTDRQPLVQAQVRCAFLAQPEERQSKTHGSAWKGILRSRVEYIGRSLGYTVCPVSDDWTGCGSCAVCRAFGSTAAGGAWEFRDSAWQQHEPHTTTRVAIDRFTGGARDGALFPQYYERDVRMTLVVHGSPIGGEDAWVNRALLHALRDLDDGLITIGPEGASGYGMASLSNVEFDGKPVNLDTIGPISERVPA